MKKYIRQKKILLELLPREQGEAVKGKELCELMRIKPRTLKKLISSLRNSYPICARETAGGGYWISKDEKEIKQYLRMMVNRRQGYTDTIDAMRKHLNDI